MKKTLLILAATLVVTSSAFARPCRRYRRPCRRPCVVECHHHHHHKSHCWHSSDWGKFAAGAAIGWLVNEASSPRQEVVYEPQPVYQPPVYTPPPVYQTTVVAPTVRQPVYETVTRTPSTTIVSQPYTTELYTPQPSVTVIRESSMIRVTQPTTIVQSYGY